MSENSQGPRVESVRAAAEHLAASAEPGVETWDDAPTPFVGGFDRYAVRESRRHPTMWPAVCVYDADAYVRAVERAPFRAGLMPSAADAVDIGEIMSRPDYSLPPGEEAFEEPTAPLPPVWEEDGPFGSSSIGPVQIAISSPPLAPRGRGTIGRAARLGLWAGAAAIGALLAWLARDLWPAASAMRMRSMDAAAEVARVATPAEGPTFELAQVLVSASDDELEVEVALKPEREPALAEVSSRAGEVLAPMPMPVPGLEPEPMPALSKPAPLPAAPSKPMPALEPARELEAFDAAAARAALDTAVGVALACRDDELPAPTAGVSVTFAPSGRVTTSSVSGPFFAGTAVGGCIARAFRSVRVPPFAGGLTTVHKTVVLR
jgi:hypothetical protein